MGWTIIGMDGFENLTAAKQNAIYNGSLGSITGEGGTGLSMYTNNGGWFQYRLPAPLTSSSWVTLMFNYKITGPGTSNVVCGTPSIVGNSGYTSTCRMALYVDNNYQLQVRSSSGATVPTGLYLTASQWFHIEYRHRYGNSASGTWALKLNGGTAVTGVGDNSGVVPAYTGIDCSSTPVNYFDDLVCAVSEDPDPTWFGPTKVRHFTPTATATGQWNGSDGNVVDNHLLVDDGDPASSDWVTAAAGSGLKDLYTHPVAAVGAIHAVQVRAAAGLDVAGSDNFSIILKSGGTEVVKKRTIGSGTPVYYASDIIQTDPATGAAWTKAGFDATQFGVGA